MTRVLYLSVTDFSRVGCVVDRVVSQHDGETFTRQLASVIKCTYSAVVVIEQGLTIPTVNCTAPRYKCLTLFTTRGRSRRQLATYRVDGAPTLRVCTLLLALYNTWMRMITVTIVITVVYFRKKITYLRRLCAHIC